MGKKEGVQQYRVGRVAVVGLGGLVVVGLGGLGGLGLGGLVLGGLVVVGLVALVEVGMVLVRYFDLDLYTFKNYTGLVYTYTSRRQGGHDSDEAKMRSGIAGVAREQRHRYKP